MIREDGVDSTDTFGAPVKLNLVVRVTGQKDVYFDGEVCSECGSFVYAGGSSLVSGIDARRELNVQKITVEKAVDVVDVEKAVLK